VRWSYKTLHFGLKKDGLLGSAFLDDAEIEETLNEYGQGGWELVSMLETRDGVLAVFKQPLEYPTIRQVGSHVRRDERGRAASSVVPTVAVKPPPEEDDEFADEPELDADYLEEPEEEEQYPVLDEEGEGPKVVGADEDEDEDEDSDSGIGSIRIE